MEVMRLNRGVTAPPRLRTDHPSPALHTQSNDLFKPSSNPSQLLSMTSTSRPHGMPQKSEYTEPQDRSQPPETPKAPQAKLCPPPQTYKQDLRRTSRVSESHSLHTHPSSEILTEIRNFASFEDEAQLAMSENKESPDLSFWNNSMALASQSPKSSSGPLTPPDSTRSRIGIKETVGQEIPVIIIDDSDEDEDNDAKNASLTWTRSRLRECPAKLVPAVVSKDDSLIEGLLMESIERDPSVGPIERFPSPHNQVIRVVESAKQTAEEWLGMKVTGERVRGDSHQYRVESLGCDASPQWIYAVDCDSWPTLMARWDALKSAELFAARQAGRIDDVLTLQRLMEAGIRVNHDAFLPKHPGWRCQYRSAAGRFALPGTRDSWLEVLRMHTIPPDPCEITAIPPSEENIADTSEDRAVEWLYSAPRSKKVKDLKSHRTRRNHDRRRGFRQWRTDLELQASNLRRRRRNCVKVRAGWREDCDLEEREMRRREQEDAEEKRIASLRKAARKEERRLHKKLRLEKQARIEKKLREAERKLQERQEDKNIRKLKRKERREKRQRKMTLREEKRQKKEQHLREEAARVEAERVAMKMEKRRREKELKKKELEESVRKYRRPSVTEFEKPAQERPSPKKRKLQETAIDSAKIAIRPKTTPPVYRDRAFSIESTMSTNTKFVKLRANEAFAKRNERPRLVQNPFRATLGERQVEARLKQARDVPLRL